MSILCFLGLFSLAWADSLEELKKALQGNDVEAAWKAVDGMTQKLSPQQREETVNILRSALKKEWLAVPGYTTIDSDSIGRHES